MADSDSGQGEDEEDEHDDALVEAKRAAAAARKALAAGGAGNWVLPTVVVLACLLNLAARFWGHTAGPDFFGSGVNFWDHLWSTAYVGWAVVAVWKLIEAIKSR